MRKNRSLALPALIVPFVPTCLIRLHAAGALAPSAHGQVQAPFLRMAGRIFVCAG